jgi:sulfur carrier protein
MSQPSPVTTIEISLNGQRRLMQSAQTISDLLVELNAQGKRVAVERNGEIVPRSLHAQTIIQHADTLEIVIAVGGG